MNTFQPQAEELEGLWLADLVAGGGLPESLQRSLSTRTYETGEILYHSGDRLEGIHILTAGRIRLAGYSSEGRLVTFRFITPPGSFGEWDLLSGIASVSAISETHSQVVLLPRVEILALYQQSTGLTQAITQQLIQTIHHLKGGVELREIRSARNRVLYYLHQILPPDQQQIGFEMPLKDVATEMGLTPESFYRTLAQLEREGLITRYPGGLNLHDLPSR